jgi:very-short-patch-repair endonuclease
VHAKGAKGGPDAAIVRLAANQHGVVSLAQLERVGINRQGRTTRLQSGRLHRIHRRVFAVGHPGLSKEGWWTAAVLACGPGAVLSHTSAAAPWGIHPTARGALRSAGEPSSVPVHVTVPRNGRSRAGIKVHRSRILFPSDVTRRAAIPVTTSSRTLVDLRRILSQSQFAAALRRAEYLGLPIDHKLAPDGTRSELEFRFLRLCRRHRLPKSEVNATVDSFIADFFWPRQRLIVELDGYRAHAGRAAFEADRARDVRLKALGYDVVRLTWRHLTVEPADTAAALRRLLRTRRK